MPPLSIPISSLYRIRPSLVLPIQRLSPPSSNSQKRFYAKAPKPKPPAQPRKHVKIVEVGPRDGLQNEKAILSTELKVELIEKLIATGLRDVESGSFVSPKWVPQMATTAAVLSHPRIRDLISYHGASISLPVLVPNLKGLENLLALLDSTSNSPEVTTKLDPITNEIAVFVAASESFSKANLNCSIAQSLENLKPVMLQAALNNIKVRGYVSVVIGCPFEGPIKPTQVAEVVQQLRKMGCYEISLGDTIGVGTQNDWRKLLTEIKKKTPATFLAGHCHDSFGTAISNVLFLVEHEVLTIDSSISGLGGCPYSPGATGNVATEDVVYILESQGYSTGILPKPLGVATFEDPLIWNDLLNTGSPRALAFEKLAEVGDWISKSIGRPNGSKAGTAIMAQKMRREKLNENMKSKL